MQNRNLLRNILISAWTNTIKIPYWSIVLPLTLLAAYLLLSKRPPEKRCEPATAEGIA